MTVWKLGLRDCGREMSVVLPCGHFGITATARQLRRLLPTLNVPPRDCPKLLAAAARGAAAQHAAATKHEPATEPERASVQGHSAGAFLIISKNSIM